MDTLDFSLDALEIKRAPSDGAEPATTFSGYASVFDTVDECADTLAPGAFAESIAEAKRSERWPAMLLNHGGYLGRGAVPIGIWTHLEEDDRGLRVEGKLAQTERGKEIAELLRMRPRPAIDGLSIGYFAQESRAEPASRSGS
jgi:HK97 family phage prohead protease